MWAIGHHWDWSFPPGPMCEKITTVEPLPNNRPASRTPSADRKWTLRDPARRSGPDGIGNAVLGADGELGAAGVPVRSPLGPPDDPHATSSIGTDTATAL